MNILVAGGSGFIGSNIIRHFKDHNIINISKTRKIDEAANNIVVDLSAEASSLHLKFSEPIDMIINCIDTKEDNEERIRQDIVESTRSLLQIAKNNKIEKFIHISIANPEDIKDEYQKSKLLAERAVENSNLQFLIFRISMVFGDGSQLDSLVRSIMSRKRIVNIGDPREKISPVHIKDVIRNVEGALEDNASWYEIYTICGPEYMSYTEMLQRGTEKALKIYNVPKILEKLYLHSVSSKFTKRAAISLERSYFHANTHMNTPLVRPKTFY